jgi:hypothetical protein
MEINAVKFTYAPIQEPESQLQKQYKLQTIYLTLKDSTLQALKMKI